MTVAQVFPVRKYQRPDGSWAKAPSVPEGVSWLTYKASEHEIASAQNVGVVIPSGRVVVDLDVYKGVTRDAIDQALGCKLDWDSALLQTTVSGGEHYMFALPNGMEVRQGSDLLGVAGFDTRAAGKGWICTGDGYTDQTFMGVVEAMDGLNWPFLPAEAVSRIASGSSVQSGDEFGLRDLVQAVADQKLDGVSMIEARAFVRKLPTEDLNSYDTWLKVGMALHHQFDADADALDLWIEWSRGAETFDEAECRSKWRGFGKSYGGQRLRFDYVIHRAGGRKVAANAEFESLMVEAESVDSLDGYDNFKSRVAALAVDKLTDDRRSMLADALWRHFGKGAGLTKTELKRELSRKVGGAVKRIGAGASNIAEWVTAWVFIEATCEFAIVERGYRLNREAFNAKYDREPECYNNPDPEARLIHASEYALNRAQIPTYADAIYMPSCGREFVMAGKSMINSYYEDGVDPAEEYTPESQAAVDRFWKHIQILVESKEEQDILANVLAHIYQRPGVKMTWAVLVQGTEGSGKSYFSRLMQLLMGRNVKLTDPTIMSGRFTDWAHGSVLAIVEEVLFSSDNKYELMDKLKQYISNDTISIEEKGRKSVTVPNTQNYLFFTNHNNALPVTENDRRYAVISSRFQSAADMYGYFGGEDKTAAYFDQLFDDLDNHVCAIAKALKEYAIPDSFKPRGRAPFTTSKSAMIRNSETESDHFFDEAFGTLACPVISDSIIDMSYFREMMLLEYGDKRVPNPKVIASIVRARGYAPLEQRRVKVTINGQSKVHIVWAKNGQDAHVVRDTVHRFFNHDQVTDDEDLDIPF